MAKEIEQWTISDHAQGWIEAAYRETPASLVDLSTALLDGYHWPGNIRQLEMVLRTVLAMREPDESELTLEHLPDSLLDDLSASERPPAGSIRENELELIRQSLDNHQGNVSAAAEALGISRATLYRKLKQLRV